METYTLLQNYWWFIISLLGGLLVLLMFVQGGQSFIFSLGKDNLNRRLIVNSTGRKWEFTFTTLVTFGGAFFASFPLFYATSFQGAYWVWMLILFCFVIQAVSFEYQNKKGNVWGSKTYQWALFINGIMGPLLIGTAVATFFTGANFTGDTNAITNPGGSTSMCVWLPYHGVQLHGLEALANPMNLVFGLAILFLSRVTGLLYFLNNITEEGMRKATRKAILPNAVLFLVFFLSFLIYILLSKGYAVNPETQEVYMEPYKYLHNLINMPYLLVSLLVGVVLVLFGIGKSVFKDGYNKGIWFHGAGVVITATTLLLCAGWGDTAYYPSFADLQSSLTIYNSSSSEYTLKVMSWVSILIPFVLAYIFYAWSKIDFHKLNSEELKKGNHY